LDLNLVSNENFSEKLWPSGWALGQATRPKTTSLMMSVTKNLQPPTKKCFWVQSTRLADPFEPLNNSLVQLTEELGRW